MLVNAMNLSGRAPFFAAIVSAALLFSANPLRASSLWLDTQTPDAREHRFSAGDSDTSLEALYWTEKGTESANLFADDFQYQSVAYSEFSASRKLSGGALHLASAFAENEAAGQMGVSGGGFRFDAFAGYGRNVSDLRGHYSGMDPYLFHGGVNQKFDFSGFSFSRDLGKSARFDFSQARVVSSGLEDRTIYSFGLASKSLAINYMEVMRGSDKVGRVYAVEAAYRKHRFGFDMMDHDNGTSYQGMNYSRSVNGKQYRVSLQQTSNPLYTKKNDSRVLFSLGFGFGRSPDRLYATPETEEQEEEGLSGGQKALIAGGIVGVAVAISSGDDDSDVQPRLEDQHAAARNILNRVNPRSVDENREYGGYIFQNPDGSYSHTDPVRGGPASILLPFPEDVIPAGSVGRATYHTHAAFDPRYDNENFSSTDLNTNRALGYDGYLGTPAGRFKYHNLATENIITLGRIAN